MEFKMSWQIQCKHNLCISLTLKLWRNISDSPGCMPQSDQIVTSLKWFAKIAVKKAIVNSIQKMEPWWTVLAFISLFCDWSTSISRPRLHWLWFSKNDWKHFLINGDRYITVTRKSFIIKAPRPSTATISIFGRINTFGISSFLWSDNGHKIVANMFDKLCLDILFNTLIQINTIHKQIRKLSATRHLPWPDRVITFYTIKNLRTSFYNRRRTRKTCKYINQKTNVQPS